MSQGDEMRDRFERSVRMAVVRTVATVVAFVLAVTFAALAVTHLQ